MKVKAALEQALRGGADRIYGTEALRLFPEDGGRAATRRYELVVTDGTGRTFYRRNLSERSYFAAVTHWIEIKRQVVVQRAMAAHA